MHVAVHRKEVALGRLSIETVVLPSLFICTQGFEYHICCRTRLRAKFSQAASHTRHGVRLSNFNSEDLQTEPEYATARTASKRTSEGFRLCFLRRGCAFVEYLKHRSSSAPSTR